MDTFIFPRHHKYIKLKQINQFKKIVWSTHGSENLTNECIAEFKKLETIEMIYT